MTSDVDFGFSDIERFHQRDPLAYPTSRRNLDQIGRLEPQMQPCDGGKDGLLMPVRDKTVTSALGLGIAPAIDLLVRDAGGAADFHGATEGVVHLLCGRSICSDLGHFSDHIGISGYGQSLIAPPIIL